MSIASYAILLFLALARYNAEEINSSDCQASECPDDLLCVDANNEECNNETTLNCQCKPKNDRGLIVTCYLDYGPTSKHVYSVPIAQNGTPIQDSIWSHRFSTKIANLRVNVDNILQQAYIYNSAKRTIYKNPNYNYGNTTQNVWTTLHKGISDTIISLAVDWISHNIYWTDPEFKWIMVQSLSSNDTSMFRVLIHENLDGPHALAVDPLEALLFWSDIGTFTKIQVSSLSGRNRMTLLYSNLLRTNSLAADHEDRRLYFVDTARGTVETVTYDGKDRKILLAKARSNFLDITVYKDSLYVADISQLSVINKTNGNEIPMTIGAKYIGYTGVAVFHDDIQPSSFTAYCEDYGCDHICLTEKDGAVCICKDGYNLNEDMKTCSLINEYFHRALVYSNDSCICILDITVLSDFVFDPVCVLETTSTKYMIMDTDRRQIITSNDTAIYWTSVDNPELHQLTGPSGIISGMAWDGYDRNVYWTEKNTGKIWRMSIESKQAQVFIEGLANPRDILILPHRRLVYWISDRNGSTIESSNIDGSNLHVVLKSNDALQWTSLSYDQYKKRLYFLAVAEGGKETDVVSCNLDGSNRDSIIYMYLLLERIEIYKGYLMVTAQENEGTSIMFYSIDIPNHMTSGGFTGSGRISDIKIFDENNRQNETGPCFNFNEECEQICVANGTSKICKCIFGFHLARDGKTCISDTIKDDFMLVGDVTHKNIYQISLNETSVQGIKAKGINPRYDPVHDRVIWITEFGNKLFSVHLNGTEKIDFPVPHSVLLFDVDYSTGNIYYASKKRNAREYCISVLSPDGKNLDIRDGLQHVEGLVVKPSDGYMFYLHNDTLVRATMDGNRSEILLDGLQAPEGLTIDYKNGYLYWIERSKDYDGFHIVYCEADGSNHTTLYKFYESILNNYAPNNLAIYKDYLFITFGKQSRLVKLKLSTPNNITEFPVPGELGKIGFVSIYSSSAQQKNEFCSDHNGRCSTFCLPVPGGGVCACEDGVEFKERSTSVCSNKNVRGLIVTCYKNYGPTSEHVYSVPIAQNGIPIQDPIWSHHFFTNIANLRVDVDNILQQAYIYNSVKTTIYKNPNYNYGNTTENVWTTLHKGLSATILSLAVDWISHNIYWTDPNFKWIMVQSLSGNDTSMFRVLIHENLERPHALALDPLEGLLFWSDIGTFTKIQVSSLSGRNRMTLLYSNLLRTNSLAADHEGRRLYFVDTARGTVETVTYDGKDRKILLAKANSNFLDIAVYKDSLYVADISQLSVINKTNGNELSMTIEAKDIGYVGVAVVHDDIQPSTVTAYCEEYGCAHICLTEKDGAMCICKDGYNLNEDMKTCSLTSKYFHRALVYSNDSSICILDVTVLADFVFDPVCVLESTGTKYMIMDTDRRQIITANDTAIYWTSVDNPELHQLTDPSGILSGMAWDGYDRNVYWTQVTEDKIWRMSIESKQAEVFIENLVNPRDILILPHRRLVYWISDRNGSTIESSNIDGSNLNVVLQSTDSLQWKSLSYDQYKKRLYFLAVSEGDEETDVVSCNLDGSNRDSFIYMYLLLERIEIYKGYLIVTAQKDEGTSIMFYSIDVPDYMTSGVFTGSGRISDIKIFDENNRQNETGPCFNFNEECEQICIANGTSRICKCIFGFYLAGDGKTCISDTIKDDFMLVGDVTHNNIYQVSLNETSVQGIKAKGINPRYDPIHDRVIWITESGNKLFSVYLNGTEKKDFPVPRHVFLFDVDHSTGNIYYASKKRFTREHYISVLSADGKHLDICEGLLYVYGLVVYPSDGYMFYLHNGTLVRATMDGNRSEILLDGLQAPEGLTIDYKNGYLYWIEKSNNPDGFHIVYCEADGSNHTTLYDFNKFVLNKYAPNNLAIYEDYLFITFGKQSSLVKLKLSTPNDITEFTVPGKLGKIGFVSTDSSSAQKKNEFCSDHNGRCSTFCLPAPGGGVCACEDGVDFKEGSTSVCSNMYTRGLIVTSRFKYQIPPVYSVPIAQDGILSQPIIWSYPVNNDVEFLSVDVNNILKQAYLYDVYTKTIKKNPNYNLGPSTENIWTTLHKGLSPAFLKLAVDWVSHNIYWTDPLFKWIMVQTLLGNDTSTFRVLIQENLEGPYALALDPYEALLFWSDIGKFTKIEVSSLSGRNRRTLLWSNLLRPYSLAADYEDRRLYFIDADRHTVETVTYEGADRKIVLGKPFNNFIDITFYQDFLYVADKNLDQLFCINKINGNEISMNIEGNDYAYLGVAVFHPDIQPSSLTDHCANYDCEHICLTEKNDVICICKDGYNLNEDNKTCSLTSEYFNRALVYSNDSSICVVDIRVLSNFVFDPVCVLETTGTKYIVLDTDRRNIIIANDTAIYWTSVDDPNLNQLTKPSGIISGMAWDGYERNVYWTEKNTGKICFTSIECDDEQIFIESLTNPRDILILPHQRMAYWISDKDGSTIESAKIDGSNRYVILKFDDLVNFKSLSYDQDRKRIYFLATSLNDENVVIYCNLDGSNRLSFLSTREHLERLDIFKGYLLATAKQADGTLIASYSIHDAKRIAYGVFSDTETISDIKFFDENDRQNETGPCFNSNGECEQFCIPNGSSMICECSFGFKLARDEKTCISDPVNDEFMLVDDITHQNIYQINLKDQSVQRIKAKGISPTYDPIHERVIWGTDRGDKLFSMHLNGTEKKDFPVPHYVYLFDVDYSTGNIYYASETIPEAEFYISVLSPDGKHIDIHKRIDHVDDLVLYPSEGYMFYLQYGLLVRSNMDGSQSETIISGLKSSKGLTIDYKNGYLYWIEASDSFNGYYIKYCKPDGTTHSTLFEIEPKFLKTYSLIDAAVYEDHLFITFNKQSRMLKLKISTPNEMIEVPVQGGLGKIRDVNIYSSAAKQKNAFCSDRNGLCSTFCLPVPGGGVCACENGVDFKEGSTSVCSNSPSAPNEL